MPEFTVTWSINVVAEDHIAAAREAKAAIQRPDTIADVFDVVPTMPGVMSRLVDLSVEDGRLPENDRAVGA